MYSYVGDATVNDRYTISGKNQCSIRMNSTCGTAKNKNDNGNICVNNDNNDNKANNNNNNYSNKDDNKNNIHNNNNNNDDNKKNMNNNN